MVNPSNKNLYTYCFDLDETLCNTLGTNYINSSPIPERIATVNELFAQGHLIKIYTARGSESGINLRDLTEKQLKLWGVNYSSLHLGKPASDFYIDDKAINVKDFNWKLN